MRKEVFAICTLTCLALAKLAVAQTFIEGNGVKVVASDLENDLLQLPQEYRATAFIKPEAVANNASTIYVRRVMAAQAQAQKMDQDPRVKAALDIARDRILSDVRLEQIDKANMPTAEAAEAYARAQYKANPEAFEAPEQVRVKHILLRSQEHNVKAKMDEIVVALKSGASFEELAKARSQDPGSAVKGGDLGLVARGRMVKPFEDAAFSLTKPGEISGIIESQFGLHILKLEERKPAGIRSFDEVKDTLIKQAQTTLINKGRLEQKDKILGAAKIDHAAIEAFAKSQATK
jgi:peptidyl-prolyl cis-trans isomerase C